MTMKLSDYSKTYIQVDELQKIMGESDYLSFYADVMKMVEAGELEATKKGRDTNGKYPPLAKKYRICRNDETADFDYEIRRLFPLSYNKDYYLGNPKEFERDREKIVQLCDYHIRTDKPLEEVMSINERSFDMTGQEKWLSSPNGSRILRNLGITEGYLNIYRTPEPFIYFKRNEKIKEKGARILIIENKDTWYTMRRLSIEGVGPFDMLIYGEGKKILKSITEIDLHDEPMLAKDDSLFYYFGDLDDEGLGMLKDLKVRFPRVQPWMPGYRYLVEEALDKKRWRKGLAQKKIGSEVIGQVLPDLKKETSEQIAELFSGDRYMPQEVMNYQVLRRLWE